MPCQIHNINLIFFCAAIRYPMKLVLSNMLSAFTLLLLTCHFEDTESPQSSELPGSAFVMRAVRLKAFYLRPDISGASPMVCGKKPTEEEKGQVG